nr:hypothetical protein [Streptomyces coryli]
MSNSTRHDRSTPLHSVSVAGAVVREDGRLLAIQHRWSPQLWSG